MKVLRSTMMPSPNINDAVSIVMRDVDLATSVAVAQAQSEGPLPGAFLITEVFDAPAGTSIEQVSHEAESRRRRNAQKESNMALLYHWNGRALERVSPNGLLSPSIPAPLSVEEIKYVYKQLAHHPNYRPGQTVVGIAEDGTRLQMKAGRITVSTGMNG